MQTNQPTDIPSDEECYRFLKAIIDKVYDDLEENQQHIPPQFIKTINDNLWDLYES